MAEIITRLVLQSDSYDSKIKRAVTGLQQMENECRKAGKSMNDMDENNRKYVQSLGSMQTVSTTVRGKIGELSGAFVELRSQYNRLTDEEKKGDFGRAMSANLEQLKTRVAEAKRELSDITKELNSSGGAGGGGGFLSGLGGKMDGMLSVFAGNLMTKATMEVANLGSEMAEMVKQGVEMAKAGEGIRIAFERLGNGQILDGLREATHGTVTDIELMKAAVKFNDFKLPIEELGTMLAFAQQKAKDTGQSVDYMVDSIVTGLGRKSLMILDNLGLSATEIKDKMAETGDMTKAVGEIIREQMSKAGDYVETAADRAAQANVDLQNKLEELGRKFLPVQEASNQLWTSMKIGILDIVGGPLARLLNGLTEAGRLRNQMNDMAGGNSSSETKKQLNFLRKTSPANRQQRYNKQLGIYTQQENAAWREVNSLKGQREAFRKEALKRGARDDDWTVFADFDKRIAEAQRKAQAWQNFRADYIRGAKELIKPVEVDIKTDNAVKGVDSLRVKLAELEAQRKKAIKAGDQDLAKNLTKQITQTKSDIKALDPNALKTTTSHTLTKPEQADAKYVQAQKDYEQSLQQAALEVKAGMISELDAKKKELSAAESLWKSIGDAREVYESPKLKEAQEKVEKTIIELGQSIKAASVTWETGLSGFNAQTMQAWMTGRQSNLSKAEIGSSEYSGIMSNIADMNTIKTILEQSMKAGIDSAQFNLEPLWEKVFDGENIDDKVWQDMVDVINAKLAEMHLDPITLDFNTGNVKKETKEVNKEWNAAASAIQAVGSAMSQIEDPAAKVMGTIAQAVATMALSYAQAANSPAVTWSGWGWIAFAATGLATMLSSISAIKQATSGFANGGVIPGNSMSGDNLRGMTPDGTVYGLNSQEIILNKAQQGNLASQLTDSAVQGFGGQPYVEGEKIFLGMNNSSRRMGRGEIVTTQTLRRMGLTK